MNLMLFDAWWAIVFVGGYLPPVHGQWPTVAFGAESTATSGRV